MNQEFKLTILHQLTQPFLTWSSMTRWGEGGPWIDIRASMNLDNKKITTLFSIIYG
jgi:hypothetical protein